MAKNRFQLPNLPGMVREENRFVKLQRNQSASAIRCLSVSNHVNSNESGIRMDLTSTLPRKMNKDRRVLRFFGDFAAKRIIVFYNLCDDSIVIREYAPGESNDGHSCAIILGAMVLNRSKPECTKISRSLQPRDFSYQSSFCLCGRDIMIDGADAQTKTILSSEFSHEFGGDKGEILDSHNEGQQFSAQQGQQTDFSSTSLSSPSATALDILPFVNNLKTMQFGEADSQATLHFTCKLHDGRLYNDAMQLNLYYNVSDDTLQIIDTNCTILLKRQRIKRVRQVGPLPGHVWGNSDYVSQLINPPSQLDYISWQSLAVGSMIQINNAVYELLGMDAYSRSWYEKRGIIQQKNGGKRCTESMISTNMTAVPSIYQASFTNHAIIYSFLVTLLYQGAREESAILRYYSADSTVSITSMNCDAKEIEDGGFRLKKGKYSKLVKGRKRGEDFNHQLHILDLYPTSICCLLTSAYSSSSCIACKFRVDSICDNTRALLSTDSLLSFHLAPAQSMIRHLSEASINTHLDLRKLCKRFCGTGNDGSSRSDALDWIHLIGGYDENEEKYSDLLDAFTEGDTKVLLNDLMDEIVLFQPSFQCATTSVILERFKQTIMDNLATLISLPRIRSKLRLHRCQGNKNAITIQSFCRILGQCGLWGNDNFLSREDEVSIINTYAVDDDKIDYMLFCDDIFRTISHSQLDRLPTAAVASRSHSIQPESTEKISQYLDARARLDACRTRMRKRLQHEPGRIDAQYPSDVEDAALQYMLDDLCSRWSKIGKWKNVLKHAESDVDASGLTNRQRFEIIIQNCIDEIDTQVPASYIPCLSAFLFPNPESVASVEAIIRLFKTGSIELAKEIRNQEFAAPIYQGKRQESRAFLDPTLTACSSWACLTK